MPWFFVRRYRPQIDVLAFDDKFLVRFPVAHVKRVRYDARAGFEFAEEPGPQTKVNVW
jgi:hypothetical protein